MGDLMNNKLVVAAVAAAAVFAGVYTGYIDISFLAQIFSGGATNPPS